MRRAERGDAETMYALARVELPKVVTALRALLDEHQPDERGRCATCRRRRFSRRLPAPCRAYLTAHLCLLAVEEEAVHGQTAHRRLRHAG